MPARMPTTGTTVQNVTIALYEPLGQPRGPSPTCLPMNHQAVPA